MNRNSLLPRLSANRPVTVLMLFLALIVVGMVAYVDIPVMLLPRGFVFPALGVWVPYNNANPSEIEEQIARPVEEIMQTIHGVKRIESNSSSSGCWVWMEFAYDTDMNVAYADIRDRMDRIMPELPQDIERVYPRKFSDDDDPVVYITAAFEKPFEDPYALLDTHVKKLLMRVDGVANVEIWGVDQKAIQILVDQAKVDAHNLNLYELVQALQRDNFVLASGYVRDGSKKFYVRSVGKFDSIEQIRELQINPNGLRLRDVAEVKFDISDEKQWRQRIDGKPAAQIGILKESQANTVDVCREVLRQFDENIRINPALDGMRFEVIFDQGTYVIESIDNLKNAGLWGGAFAFLILFYFLRRFRMTLIINLAIPISLLATIVVIYFVGWSLNIMTLMGLMVSVGLVVDNSIVVVENIYRLRKEGMSRKDAAIQGASEVAMPITMATLTTVVVFLPLIFMGNNPGMTFYMARMGLPIISALLASLIVALIFIPLATIIFSSTKQPVEAKSIAWTREFYERLLKRTLARPVDATLIFILMVISAFAIMGKLPQTDETRGNINNVWFFFEMPSNYTLAQADEFFREFETFVDSNRTRYAVRTVDTRFRANWGRMEIFLHAPPEHEWWQVIAYGIGRQLGLIENGVLSREEVLEDIKEHAPKRPGIDMRTRWRRDTGTEQGIVTVTLYGDDTNRLTVLAKEVERRLRSIPGVLDVDTDLEEGVDEIRLTLNREQAAKFGVNPQSVAGTVSYALRGVELPDYRTEDQEIDIRIQMRKQDRETLHQLMNLRLSRSDGQEVPLANLADINVHRGYGRIRRENGKTMLAVTASTTEEDLQSLYRQVDQVMEGFTMPRGYSWGKGQRFSRMQDNQDSTFYGLILAVTFVLLLMGVLFESVILPLSVIVCIPFAIFGVAWTLFLTRTPLDMMANIGLFVLIGVVVNNAIVLVDLINQLRLEGYERTEAILEAGRQRFRPILMTAATTIFGLVPMAMGTAKVIGISYAPLGRTLIGGMISATALTLLVVPVAYVFFDNFRLWMKQVFAVMFSERKPVQVSPPVEIT